MNIEKEIKFTIHIHLKKFANGKMNLEIDDIELYDFVEDYLVEENDIEFDYVKSIDGVHTMFFETSDQFERISAALKMIDEKEILKIWQINN